MNDCCSGEQPRDSHLLIVGGGSAAFAAALKAAELGARATLINAGLPTGGTCVNTGCVPSKTLIRAAEAHYRAAHPHFDGIESSSRVADFQSILSQKGELVARLRQHKYLDVISGLDQVTLVQGRARLLSRHSVEVEGREIQGHYILIATGARPRVVPVPGLRKSGYLTNESAFELERLPRSLIVLGGRFLALECAQMFSRLGTRVTLLQRSPRILPPEAPDLTEALSGYLQGEGMEIVTDVTLQSVSRKEGTVQVRARVAGESHTFEADEILVATGRRPNTDDLGLEDLGVELDEAGFLKVKETLQTSVEGIYGAGDVTGEPMFVSTAAYEGALAAENALRDGARRRDYTVLPWVVFTDPQMAGVGLDEGEAALRGFDVDTAKLPLAQVPRALAARDTRGFIKLIRDRKSDLLLGARILAPEGAELLMEVSLAIRHGVSVRELATTFHPYLTLSEGIKLAAIAFDKDVDSLSCCAA